MYYGYEIISFKVNFNGCVKQLKLSVFKLHIKVYNIYYERSVWDLIVYNFAYVKLFVPQ